ncbi:hypothetical protein [Modestobacter sp. VKM Ac-2977]|uniref:hypothetical protein n=1 Tax=Modestobacter sp. VKM Ac-2977 TaxID=3004131 RepID=UPI0022AAC89F|nr:hypothetical protein [Modestobacter sp. VKM Ac-2977]
MDVGSPANPADIEQILADDRTLGITYFGSGTTAGAPWIGELATEADWIAYAGLDPVDVIEAYGKRIKLFHVEDLNPLVRRRARPALRRPDVRPLRGRAGGPRLPHLRDVLR